MLKREKKSYEANHKHVVSHFSPGKKNCFSGLFLIMNGTERDNKFYCKG